MKGKVFFSSSSCLRDVNSAQKLIFHTAKFSSSVIERTYWNWSLCKIIFAHNLVGCFFSTGDVAFVFESANSFFKGDQKWRTVLWKKFSTFRPEQSSSEIAPNYQERIASQSSLTTMSAFILFNCRVESKSYCLFSKNHRTSATEKLEWDGITSSRRIATQDGKQTSTGKPRRENTDSFSKLLHGTTAYRKNKLMANSQRVFVFASASKSKKWRASPNFGPRSNEKSKEIFAEKTLW